VVWETQSIPYETNLCLNGAIHELEGLSREIAGFCAQHGLGDEAEFQLNLVLEELFVNAVRHGGCDGMPSAARMHLRRDGALVRVIFFDRGNAFDLTAAPHADVDAPLSERRGGGLGIHLVRQIMREVAYRREGEWNVLTMEYTPEHAVGQVVEQPVEERQETL
jgi:serine/threonine-protein kinase RsbW